MNNIGIRYLWIKVMFKVNHFDAVPKLIGSLTNTADNLHAVPVEVVAQLHLLWPVLLGDDGGDGAQVPQSLHPLLLSKSASIRRALTNNLFAHFRQT